MLNIETRRAPTGLPLLRLAFRPFFLAAMLFAVVSVAGWLLLYHNYTAWRPAGFDAVSWHGHEMVFGYAMAVIAGFLLTAIKNWTGRQTVHGAPLAWLAACWLLARLMPLIDTPQSTVVMAVADMLFMAAVVVAASIPVWQARQVKQVGILAKLVLLLASNLVFYLGLFGLLEDGVRWGLYSGVYLVIALILVMGRRVIPFFIEKGVDTPVTITNYRWVDISSLLLLLALWLLDVFAQTGLAVAIVAALLTGVHIIRLVGWHSAQLWRKPLLWVLYVAYSFIVLGFAIKAASPLLAIPPGIALHAFTYGGIGIMTAGMMARVSLGHTGRNVFEPPASLTYGFALLLLGAVVRVILPLLAMQWYANWILLSQLLWIAAFMLLLLVYAPMLTTTRVDGRDG